MGRLFKKYLHKKTPTFLLRLWCEPGLNRRHMDFQSIALPTELSHLIPEKEFKEISPKGMQK